MKVIIAGCRTLAVSSGGGLNPNLGNLEEVIRASRFPVSEVVSGTADGADRLGELWAATHGIAVKRFYPDWAGLGKKAGPVRNGQMVAYADALIALWDGVSRGTADILQQAGRKMASHPFLIFVHRLDDPILPSLADRKLSWLTN